MQVEIQARRFTLTQALRDYVKKRMNFALRSRDDDIQLVRVRLSDTNGPKGGIDKRCFIQVSLNRKPDIVIKDTKENMYTAIDHAAERVAQAVARKLKRQRNHVRTAMRRLAPAGL